MTTAVESGMNLRYNLFRLAPRELSHSAYWAWILQCTDTREEELLGPRAVGLSLLAKIGARPPSTRIEVETEVPLPYRAGRADIRATIDGGMTLVIENKTTSIPSAEQLDRYERALANDGQQVSFAILSTAFDVDVADEIRLRRSWRYLRLDDLLDVTLPHVGSHSLVDHYAAWIEAEQDRRVKIASNAISDDPDARTAALEDPIGQWALMEAVTRDLAGHQYRGKNRSGTPWTQFCFVDAVDDRDHLFYRIDGSTKGHYFSLRQYQSTPSPNAEAKRQRLVELRAFWATALEVAGSRLMPTSPRNRGTKESEVGLLLLDENPPSVLIADVKAVHNEFCSMLKAAGWKPLMVRAGAAT